MKNVLKKYLIYKKEKIYLRFILNWLYYYVLLYNIESEMN